MNPACGIGDIPGSIDALGHCHQVLAYRYNLDDSNNLTLWVYDPNDPGDDDSTILLNISNAEANLAISAPSIESHIEQPAYAIRGLFRSQYTFSSPAAMLQGESSSSGSPIPVATLTGATVQFDNISSGKDNTENYWLYLIPGGVTNAVASFAEASYPGTNPIGYSQNQQVGPLSLNIVTSPPTFSVFGPQAGGSLQIAVHGNFGGLHNNSDWKTGVVLNLTFQDTKTWALPPIVWPETDLHADSSNPSATYTFGFVWNASVNAFVAG
jgi:hypothetical protein